MTTLKLDIRTPDGVADCVAFRPNGVGPFPAVIFFFDAGGIRPAMEEMASRLSSYGYFVLLPNFYYRAGAFAAFDAKTIFSNPAERARMGALVKTITPQGMTQDIEAFREVLAKQPGVTAERVGCVGYCLGGRWAFGMAGTIGEYIAAAASIHGGHLASDAPDSPHRNAAKVRARLYFAIADNDASCPPEQQATLASALDAAQVRYQVELYPGAAHGFAVPDMLVYNKDAAERHWERIAALFAESLPRA